MSGTPGKQTAVATTILIRTHLGQAYTDTTITFQLNIRLDRVCPLLIVSDGFDLTLSPRHDGRCVTCDVAVTDTVASPYLRISSACAASAAEAAAKTQRKELRWNSPENVPNIVSNSKVQVFYRDSRMRWAKPALQSTSNTQLTGRWIERCQ
jgi:hypothetical protein